MELMVGELLASAFEVAHYSKSDMRVAALLRIARVQTAVDRGQARCTFEQALDEIRRIPGRDATLFLKHARFFAAAIAPDLLPSIPVQIHRPRHLDTDSLGRIMMEHGNLEPAMELAMRYDGASTFPFSLANKLMERVSEQERLALLRRAIEAGAKPTATGLPRCSSLSGSSSTGGNSCLKKKREMSCERSFA